MPYLKTHNAEIYYEYTESVVGSPTITLVNGHTRSMSDFKQMTKFLLSKGVSVLALDNRGAGQTKIEAGFELRDMADDVMSLWAELGLSSSHLLGISMGGYISQLIASRAGEFLDSLVLVSTFSHPKQIADKDAAWASDLEGIQKKMSSYFSKKFLENNALLVRAMSKNILKSIEQDQFESKSNLQNEAIRNFDLSKLAYDEILAPTLIIHGDEDHIIPIEAAESLSQLIHDARLRVFDGDGHLLIAENPKNLYQEIYDWIDELA